MNIPRLLEMLDNIEHRSDDVFVRAEIAGTWQNVALSNLPTRDALKWVCTWLRLEIKRGDGAPEPVPPNPPTE